MHILADMHKPLHRCSIVARGIAGRADHRQLRVWESIVAQVLLLITDMKHLVDLSALQMLQFIRHLAHFLKDVKGAVVFGLHRQGGTEIKCSSSVYA